MAASEIDPIGKTRRKEAKDEPKKPRKEKKSKKVKAEEVKVEVEAAKVPKSSAPPETTFERKPKKEKKAKAKEPPAVATASVSPRPAASPLENANSEEPPQSSRKKRKRDSTKEEEEEIEIDVSLPEPLSKKAARKAKKSKPCSSETTNGDTAPQTAGEAAKPQGKAEKRTAWGIWIGNLPWTATKQELRSFLCGTGAIKDTEISRVHLPAPSSKGLTRPGEPKSHNKGFAYVDFDSPEGLEAALKMSETAIDSTHRKVLIKNANSFEGRPEKKTVEDGAAPEKSVTKNEKPVSKRVFVGNLGFETTKDDLTTHYSQCGEVTDIHMATFEDTGKCKGFAWITFDSEDASSKAVQGFIFKKDEDDSEDDDEDEDVEMAGPDSNAEIADETSKPNKPSAKKSKKAKKPRKWYVNQLYGRKLRVEFAEDPSVRYKKRFGKDAPSRTDAAENNDGPAPGLTPDTDEFGRMLRPRAADGAPLPSSKPASTPHERRREARKREYVKVDARTIKPGAALANAQRATGAIVEAKGSKITFD